MSEVHDYQVGDCVRLTCDLLVASAGTQAVIKSVVRDEGQKVRALTVLINSDSAHTFGTTVFPHEVEVVAGPGACPTHDL